MSRLKITVFPRVFALVRNLHVHNVRVLEVRILTVWESTTILRWRTREFRSSSF